MKSTGHDFVALCRERRRTDTSKKYQSVFQMFDAALPKLPPTWVWTSISELSERVSVGHVGPTSEFFTTKGNGVPFIRSQDVRPGRLMLDTVAHVTEEFHNKLKKSQLKPGDVLVVRVGANRGDCCIVPNGVSELNCANIVFARPMYPNGFIGFFLRSELGQGLLASLTTGSAQGVLNTQSIAAIPVPVPPLPTQRKIAGVLSAYDDLIENNTRRIAILEEMAQAIYREWFVNFRFPGHDKVKLINSPLGKIPEGWCASVLGDHLAALETGKRPKGGATDTEGIPSVGAENVISIGKHNYSAEKYVSIDYFSQMTKGIVQDRDVALYKDGAYIGRSTYFRDGFPHRSFCVNEHVFLLRSNGERMTQNLLYLWLQEPNTVASIRGTNANAAQPGINQKGLTGVNLIAPSPSVAKAFDSEVEPMLHGIATLAKKDRVLRQTRDLLLPKLISGQLDVEELDIETGEPLVEAEA